jgi:hypothetical protein
MAAALAALPTAWRAAIISVICGETCLYVELSRCDPEAAMGIGQALRQAFANGEERDIIINGLDLSEIDGSELMMPWSRSQRPLGAR